MVDETSYRGPSLVQVAQQGQVRPEELLGLVTGQTANPVLVETKGTAEQPVPSTIRRNGEVTARDKASRAPFT